MALFRCGSGSSGSGYNYLSTTSITVTSRSGVISGLTSGKSYYMIVDYAWSNNNFNAEISAASNTTGLTKIASNQEKVSSSVAAYLNSSVYTFTATSTSSGLTFSSFGTSAANVRITLFESA